MLFPLTILALATLAAGDCAADNCLRALRATQTPGRLEAAQSFCATFTRATVAPTAIPSYAVDACKQNQNGPLSYRISSACSCIATSSSSASATSVSATGYAPCATVSSSAAAQLATAPKGMLHSKVAEMALTNPSNTHCGGSVGSRLSQLRSIAQRCGNCVRRANRTISRMANW